MSMKTKHLVVVISGHGYGHAVMTAPLINALHERHPKLRITLKTDVPKAFLQRKFNMPFGYLPDSSDFGMVMHSAFEVDTVESLEKYKAFHQDWPTRLEAQMAQLKQLEADSLLSNIAYLPLVAAKQLKRPCVAYSCLNWAEIFHHYFANQANADQIYQQMLEAYSGADCIISTEPAMPMAGLMTQRVGPIASQGINRRTALLNLLGLPNSTRLVLATMGGIKTDMNQTNWPEIEDVHYLVLDLPSQDRRDISSLSTSHISFTDILCSVDLLFTKPGYGSFTEAAIHSIPVLYVERKEWPEHIYLTQWLEKYTACRAITQQQLSKGDFISELIDLLAQKNNLEPPASGLPEAIKLTENHLFLD